MHEQQQSLIQATVQNPISLGADELGLATPFAAQ